MTSSLAWPKKNHAAETCDVDFEKRKTKSASLKDYVGIHYRKYEHCGRSGVDTSEFKWTRKRLGNEITLYLENDPVGQILLKSVRSYISDVVDLSKNEKGKAYRKNQRDIYRELSRFIINGKAPRGMHDWKDFSHNVSVLMGYIQNRANDITVELEKTLPAFEE